MIDGIITYNSYRYLSVSSTSVNTISTSNPGSGHVRYMTGKLEVYDGYNWIPIISGYQAIDLTPEAQNAIDWANEKRQQEIEETALLEKYPSLKSAKGQYDMIRQLCMAEEKNGVIE